MRARHMAAHLDFLERNGDRIRAAGPLRDAADGSPGDGLWIVEAAGRDAVLALRSEEHTSELQSLMRISYAVFCLKKKKQTHQLSKNETRASHQHKRTSL